MKKKLILLCSLMLGLFTLLSIKTFARTPSSLQQYETYDIWSFIEEIQISDEEDTTYDFNALVQNGYLVENKLLLDQLSYNDSNDSYYAVDIYFSVDGGIRPLPSGLMNVQFDFSETVNIYYWDVYMQVDNSMMVNTINLTPQMVYNYGSGTANWGIAANLAINELYFHATTSERGTLTALNINQDITNNQYYENGYNDGYSNGYNEGYDIGESNGYDSGYDIGEIDGYSNGYNEGVNSNFEQNAFKNLINELFSYPVNFVKTIFNFEIFGVNVSQVILFIVSIGIVAFVIKRFR